MGNNIQKLMEDYKQKNKYKETKKLVNKWETTGLLEGLDNEHDKHNMAIMLENQGKRLIKETSRTQTSPEHEGWSDIALPLVRRTLGKVVSQDLLSVQPMSMPSGLIFWLYFEYGNAKPENNNIYDSGESIYGNVSSSEIDGNLYNWDYSYTKNYISSSAVSATMTSASWSDFEYSNDISASLASNPDHYKKIEVSQSDLTDPDVDVVKAFTISDSNVDKVYRNYNKKNSDSVFFIASGSHDSTLDQVEYVKDTTVDDRGDFEAGQSGVGEIPEIDIDMEQKAITPTTRKLKAQWTPEFAQDINAYHSIDAEAEVTNIMSDYIAMEIDMELLGMINNNVIDSLTDYWSAKINNFVDSDTGGYVSDGGTFTGTQQEWYQTLLNKVNKVSNKIHKRTLMGGANWLVVGTGVATVLESLDRGFVSVEESERGATEYAMGVEEIGTLNQQYTVYKNPYFHDNVILMGYRGGSFLQTGAVYAPYVPLMTTPTVRDPDTFESAKAVFTRGAKEMVRPEFYGKIICRDLNVV